MRWTERLLGLATNAAGTPPEQLARLPASLARAVDSLARCADLAPNAASEAELRQLTERAEALRGRVGEALAGFSLGISGEGSQVDVPPGRNHWGRLVAALEQHREIRSQLLEAAISLSDTNAELSAELDRLAREEGALIEQLRNLIARCDPQAED